MRNTAQNNEFWTNLHERAWRNPQGFEIAIKGIYDAANAYCLNHFARYGETVSNDGVLGQEVESLIRVGIALLNGETGRLDCGTVDALFRKLASENGFDGDTL